MGASNFARHNASKTFVVFETEYYNRLDCQDCGHIENYYEGETLPKVCPECKSEHISFDDIIIDTDWIEEKDNLKEYIKELLPHVQINKEDKSDNDRNYPTTTFGKIEYTKKFGDYETGVTIYLQYTSGYYEAANLDWDIKYGYDYSADSIKDEIDQFNDYSEMNKGIKAMLSPKIEKWLTDITEQLIKEVEDVFEKVSSPYQEVAQFSNGETIYTKL